MLEDGLAPLQMGMSAEQNAYVEAKLTPTLAPALAALARAKPADPVVWLANWLLEHKPAPVLQPPGTAAAMQSFVDAFESEEGKAELKALFLSLDKDGDGQVTGKEWGKAVGTKWKEIGKFFGGLSKEEVGKMFKKLDADGSGTLTWDEFEGALQNMDMSLRLAQALESKEGLAELKALWDTLDKDGDGHVTGKEWGSAVKKNEQVLKKFFGGKNLKQIGKHFNKLDVDGSGDLTWDEFVSGSIKLVA